MIEFSPERTAIDIWGITPVNSRRILSGESTMNWQIDTDDETYVLRNAGRFGGYVSMQAALLDYLYQKGFPYAIPRLTKISNDNVVEKVEDDFYMMYPYVSGETGVYPGYDYRELGAMLGSYHHYSQDFQWSHFDQRRSKELFDDASISLYVSGLIDTLGGSGELLEDFRREYGTVEQLRRDYTFMMRELGKVALVNYPRQVCHGDYSPDNVLSNEGIITGLIDFGGITIDPKVTDLATTVSRTAITDSGYDSKITRDLIEGYSKSAVLDNNEERAVIPLAFIDTVRSLSWQTSELTLNPTTRVTRQSTLDYMHKVAVLRDSYSGTENSL